MTENHLHQDNAADSFSHAEKASPAQRAVHGEAAHAESRARPPRVLLARLSPVAAVGMRRMLSEDGVEIVGEESRPLAIEALAREVAPDAVVLALGAGGARTLCDRIRLAAPDTTVIMWASEENRMRIAAPGTSAIREVAAGGLADLRRELISTQSPTEE
jgi:hypothetical protein